MITITNTGPVKEADPDGVWNYDVAINGRVVASFKHTRKHGLGACLMRAAVATVAAENAQARAKDKARKEKKV
jgi:predicted GNAT family N-acyltransferase